MPENLVFAGTPGFALASLEALARAGRRPTMVLTQPDRPAGRGRRVTQSPVKRYAAELGIPVRQPVTLKDEGLVAELAELRPQAIIVAAYGMLLPPAVLDLPRIACINVHASLLPRWRGASPVEAALLAGDRETGISLMRMEEGLDTGPVYARQALGIGAADTAGMLHERLAVLGGELLVRHLPGILAQETQPVPQDERLATYAGKIDLAAAKLDWRSPATCLLRCVRAYNPRPGAWFRMGDEMVKCWDAEVPAATEVPAAEPPGRILTAGRLGIDVACGRGVIRLLELQREGRRRVTAGEFAGQLKLAGALLPA